MCFPGKEFIASGKQRVTLPKRLEVPITEVI
jgi:hypothetical protein